MCHRHCLRETSVGRSPSAGPSLLAVGGVTHRLPTRASAATAGGRGEAADGRCHHVDAVYPPSALPAREHADVVLTVTVDADGHVSKVDVAQSSGAADLDEAAIVAARQWTFNARDARRQARREPHQGPVPLRAARAAARGRRHVASRTRCPRSRGARRPRPRTGAAAGSRRRHVRRDGRGGRRERGIEEVDVRGRIVRRKLGTRRLRGDARRAQGRPANERVRRAQARARVPPHERRRLGPRRAGLPARLRRARGAGPRVHASTACPSTTRATTTATATPTRTSSSRSSFTRCACSRGRTRRSRGTSPSRGAPTTSSGSTGAGSRRSTRSATSARSGCSSCTGPNDAPPGTFAGAEYYTTDGFGTNRQAKRGTAIGQWETPLGKHGTLRVNATAYATEYNNAGVVREDDYEAGKVGFYGTEDPNQTGNTASRASLSATYEGRFKDIEVSQQLFVIDRTMRLRENWTGFLLDVQEPTQEPHGQRGDLIDFHFDEVTFGGRGFARWHGEALGLRQEFEGGYFARIDSTHSTQDRVAAGTDDPYLHRCRLPVHARRRRRLRRRQRPPAPVARRCAAASAPTCSCSTSSTTAPIQSVDDPSAGDGRLADRTSRA